MADGTPNNKEEGGLVVREQGVSVKLVRRKELDYDKLALACLLISRRQHDAAVEETGGDR